MSGKSILEYFFSSGSYWPVQLHYHLNSSFSVDIFFQCGATVGIVWLLLNASDRESGGDAIHLQFYYYL